MNVAIGNDHRGIDFKNSVIKVLKESGHIVTDFGANTPDPVDYPDIAKEVGEAVVAGKYDKGIVICGTGLGVCIAANKVKGVRAALCDSVFCAERGRQHNDANVLCMGSEIVKEQMPSIVIQSKYRARSNRSIFLRCIFDAPFVIMPVFSPRRLNMRRVSSAPSKTNAGDSQYFHDN